MKLSVGAKISLFLPLAGILAIGITLMIKLSSPVFLIIAIAIIALCVIVGIISINKEKKERFCSQCGKAYSLDDVDYEEIDRKVKTYNFNPNGSAHQLEEKLTYKVKFDCTCPGCGATKTYTKTLDGGESYYDGKVNIKNPEQTIRDYFSSDTLSFNEKKSIVSGILVSIALFVLTIIIAIINFSGIISGVSDAFGNVGSRLDASNYYGTYYAVDNSYTEYELTISDGRTTLKTNEVFGGGGIITEDGENQVIYNSEYMQSHYADDRFENCPALLFGSISKKIFWISLDEGGNYTFSVGMADGSILTLTTEKVTRKTLTNDPENYYGTYKYGSESIKLSQNGGANTNINSYVGTYRYIYASGSTMLSKFNISGYSAAIIVIVDQYENMYLWFGIDGTSLVLQGRYDFVKK